MKKINRIVVYVSSLVMLLSMSPSFANAASLEGHPRYVFSEIGAATGLVYIYRSTGAFCGIAELSGVGSSSSSTVAFQAMLDVMIRPLPGIAGNYVGVYTSAAAGFCNATSGPMTAYYVRYN